MLDFNDALPQVLPGAIPTLSQGLKFTEVRAAVIGREDVVYSSLGISRPPRGQHMRCPFPSHEDRNPSFRIDESTGRYFCTCSSGDVFDAVQAMGFADTPSGAAKWIGDVLNLQAVKPVRQRVKPEPVQQRPASKTYPSALRRLAESVEIGGTPGEAYFRSRGITIPLSGELKFHHGLRDTETEQFWPAVIAIVRNQLYELIGIQRIFILPDGSGRAKTGKKTLGSLTGGGFYHSEPGEHIGLAEGPETALAVEQLFGIPCVATLSAGNMRNFVPPDCVKRITIFADSGKAGMEAAASAAERLLARGFAVERQEPLHGDDFNDDLQKGAKAADYAEPKSPPAKSGVTIDDFLYYMPAGRVIYRPDGALWPLSSVNARVPWPKVGDKEIPPSQWLAKRRPVEQLTWMPGVRQLIRDRLISEGGWFERQGVTVFNQYRPPAIELGSPDEAGPWIEHIERIYPGDAAHIIAWLAHRRQRPGEKVNHAIVLGGVQGIGKDALLEPVKRAIGPWNMQGASPPQVLGRFNGYIKSVILRMSEARDLGAATQFEFYEKCKVLIAAPPDVVRCDEKNIKEHSVPNVCGVIITTNHRTNGLYLPADDRRHYVAWSEATRDGPEGLTEEYFRNLWRFYETGGFRHVAAYLETYDLADFSATRPPPKTDAFWAIVDAGRPSEESEMADVIDKLGKPDAITIQRIIEIAEPSFADWLRDRKNRRVIGHRIAAADYVVVRNPNAKEGQWKIGDKRQTIYARSDLSLREQIEAARMLADQ